MIERSLDPYHTNEPNDLLALKAHYIKTLIDLVVEKKSDELDKTIGEICKKSVRTSFEVERRTSSLRLDSLMETKRTDFECSKRNSFEKRFAIFPTNNVLFSNNSFDKSLR